MIKKNPRPGRESGPAGDFFGKLTLSVAPELDKVLKSREIDLQISAFASIYEMFVDELASEYIVG